MTSGTLRSRLVACLLNVSEARRTDLVENVAKAALYDAEGVQRKETTVLNIFNDQDYNRSVITIVASIDSINCFFSPPGSNRAVSSRRRGAVCVPGGVRAHRHARARGRAPQHGVGGPDPHLPAGGGGEGAGLRPAGPGGGARPHGHRPRLQRLPVRLGGRGAAARPGPQEEGDVLVPEESGPAGAHRRRWAAAAGTIRTHSILWKNDRPFSCGRKWPPVGCIQSEREVMKTQRRNNCHGNRESGGQCNSIVHYGIVFVSFLSVIVHERSPLLLPSRPYLFTLNSREIFLPDIWL
ncbi:formiminotransferase N-terminal subdomain-containing protein isoform X2 [Xiphophorus couchianus]|uniref:formiminotransferase N-terminal subdomain-containing protein isoform X2 n=1 Tax=Xiphophorus couchianus TaxID=32473 RepID=UPI001016543F|nr:formiminotransferase N-terminal subdomain-containing protein isoform X2 [Xiphophorus couchianus]